MAGGMQALRGLFPGLERQLIEGGSVGDPNNPVTVDHAHHDVSPVKIYRIPHNGRDEDVERVRSMKKTPKTPPEADNERVRIVRELNVPKRGMAHDATGAHWYGRSGRNIVSCRRAPLLVSRIVFI